MKIIIGANISANGKVLLEEDPNQQAPEEAVISLVEKATQIGNLVIGKKTFDLMQQVPGGIKQVFPGLEVVLLSSTESTTADIKIVRTPEQAIDYLKRKGFEEIAVGGGTKTYNAFIDKELVTDIYFNIIPSIVGNGGVLGTMDNLLIKFKLKTRLLTDGIVQLHLTKV